MTKSRTTEVNITQSTLIGQTAQITADSAASQAENANSATLIAQSTANAAKSAADSTYAYANSEIAVQSTATAKAQSAADSAFSQAVTAIDNGEVTSQAVTTLKDGSTMTIADLENGLATKVANSDYASYKEQTASQIGQMVSNSAFSAYQTTTADLIAQKVANSDFSAYQATTAEAISSKVESSDFKTYQTQTDDMISSKVSKSDANNANLIPYSSNFTIPLTGWTLMDWGATDRKLLVTTHNFYQNGTGALLYLNTAQNGTAAAGSNRFPLLPNTTYTFQFKAFASSNVVGANVYLLSRAYGSTSDYDTVHGLFNNLVTSPSQIDQYTVTFTTGANDNEGYIRVDNIGSNNSASSGLFFTELKLELGNTATPYVYGGQDSMISQMSDDINLRVTKDSLIDQINLQAGNTLISSSGQLTLSGETIYFDTSNPVIIPSANITGTLNGKTINAGTQLNQYGNTGYPLTLSPDGSVTSTSFETIDTDTLALRTVIKDGTVDIMVRGMTPLSSGMYSGMYPSTDINLGNGQLALFSGRSTSQDPNFTATGITGTGYAILDANTGLALQGDSQQIQFNGLSTDTTDKGIIFTPYGNINPNGDQGTWYIGHDQNSQTANFGIDSAGINEIYFKRQVNVGAVTVSTGGTFALSNGGDFWFGKTTGGLTGIHAGAVNYTSLVKSSLLSVKKDVQKADTAYWAQLVNSIDLATYQYKSDDNTSHIRLSSIVDDVNDTKQWRLPDVFINRDEDGRLNGVDDSVLLNATLATVQEQQKQIDQLNGHNMELEARLRKLEEKVNG
ncbi:carbohydrate binding domain-containing protein [Lactiplantibacillus fabifermentans]|uniref:Peptidase S74 domain-containing protein n=1 Tax=Lactiplantibacillus fabifermentans DSM 21115 TaxID=1413187 RepID=A0A0R2NLU7_9LACO|nr:carbohydrate binding domain-containing protein [Lactiplantibacillus fabifermentans]KRO24787.1 hypothetical protein DY78_GL001576 [Lactiplantibacillus fabifermentans DSM 21115]